jgi:hypothetical protein
MMVELCDSDW